MAVVWLLTVFAGIYLLQRMAFRLWGAKGVRYERFFSEAYAFAGQRVVLNERLANAKLLPLPWFRVETVMPAMLRFHNENAEMAVSSGALLQNHASLFSLSPFTRVLRKHEVTCVRRGVYRLSSLTCTIGDALGGSAKTFGMTAECELTVLPRLKEAGQLPVSVRKFMQSVLSMHDAFREDHEHVAGVRDYRSGDPLKQVNWSATAKAGRMLVNKRESMTDNDLIVVLNAELMDSAANRRVMPEVFEEAVSYAASVLHSLIHNGGKAGLIFNGRVVGREETPLRVEPRAGREHLFKLLHLMAVFEAEVRRELSYVLEELAASGLRNANLLLVTAFLTPKQRQLVDRLRHAGNRVETLLLYREAVV
ncbi:DUF58 domain-containing protein [Cohnella thailandensis]|uniref:DUF58 domain-containing protein n=1 Tax=Cohnella thailandensis TaxID=557557 RepID=A0A841SWQ8_9BACL|nr:DUF58 domain-containing protein [Cohnella thailandensis]MBB6634290.1 DUF58 domain-containing protein [Cohnella thailandensis]MBP1972212.1 uncharacterized protein (DUF58 family) [Cohnella thailandensis]